MGNNAVAADELRLLIERIERLEQEKKGIADDIKDVYGEAKSRGFCAKTIRRVVALRKLREDVRREMEAMLDLYKGALGMLDGTPLGTWAVEKLKKDEQAKRGEPKGDAPAEVVPPPEPAPEAAAPALTIGDAKRLGAEAAREGKAVTANPFPPRDPRRAAWDEAWCRELGTDGMDIPAALRPAGKKPKGEQANATAPDGGSEIPPNFDPAQKAEPTGDGETPAAQGFDPAYGEARAAVLREQYASVSKIQKWLTIGYNRAAAIMEQLEREGVVSAPEPTGKRDVLLDEQGRRK